MSTIITGSNRDREPEQSARQDCQVAVEDLRGQLRKIVRHKFLARGYLSQMRLYRAAV